jgi:hypothetical protein
MTFLRSSVDFQFFPTIFFVGICGEMWGFVGFVVFRVTRVTGHCLTPQTLTAHRTRQAHPAKREHDHGVRIRNELASTINRHRCLEYITADPLCEFQGRR